MKSRSMLISICFVFVLGSTIFTNSVFAIPAFAREYHTSCATCHIAIPKLNAFGEAFRRNGYQFPAGGDPDVLKEEPVSLGQEAYKKVFPNAIWPASISHLPGFAVAIESEAVIRPESEDEPKLDFNGFGGEVELLMGGAIRQNISLFGELEVAGDEIEIERGFVTFSNIADSWLKPSLLNLRVGKFEPGVLSVSNVRKLTPKYWITTKTVGDNQWSLESSQKGLELNGVISGRLGYNLGLVEGRKNLPNSAKDFYGHVNYKLGGMRLDGVSKEGKSPLEAAEPWIDDSINIGGFAYKGFADIEAIQPDNKKVQQRDNFTMVGGDVNIFFKSLNLIGGLALRNHDQPTAAKKKISATDAFVEASYVIFPWLVPVARFETFSMEDETETRIVPTLNLLLRANTKLTVAAEIEKAEEEFEAEEIEFALLVAF